MFEELDAIPERIVDVCVIDTVERFAGEHRHQIRAQPLQKLGESLHDERRMRLLRRLEVRLHTKVDLQITAFEPTPASTRETRRLRYLGYLEQRFVKIHRVGLAPGWHGELNVVDAPDLHAPILGYVSVEKILVARMHGSRAFLS